MRVCKGPWSIDHGQFLWQQWNIWHFLEQSPEAIHISWLYEGNQRHAEETNKVDASSIVYNTTHLSLEFRTRSMQENLRPL